MHPAFRLERHATLLSEAFFIVFLLLMLAGLFYIEHPCVSCLFVEGNQFAFWAAGLSFVHGVNPYDTELASQFASSMYGVSYPVPEAVWSPPLFHPLMSWYALFSFEQFRIVNFLLVVSLLTLSVWILSRRYQLYRDSELLMFSRFLIVTSLPLCYVIMCSPNLPYILLGLSVFLYLTDGNRLSDNFLAGIFLGLCAIKPHVLLYVYCLVLIDSVRERSIKTLLGIVTTCIVLLSSGLLQQETILINYLQAVPDFPNGYLTPTLNRWIVHIFNLPLAYLSLYALIPVPFIAIYFYFYRKNRGTDNALTEIAIVASIILAPYLWTYEFVLLIPVAFKTLADSSGSERKAFFYLYLTGNLLLILTSIYSMGYQVWYPVSMFAGYLALKTCFSIEQKSTAT